jgi:uncharacterized protein YbjT (DUF2867 family)
MNRPVDMVTGAFSYTGRAIANELIIKGHAVRTLTRRSPDPGPLGDLIEAFPFHFDEPKKLTATLEGTDTVYNTYWVRFERGEVEFSRAVRNTETLIDAARGAAVRRFVHISITNPTASSSLPYFRGKALVEKALVESGLSYGIVRPTVIFGRGDVFINNIAWILRHLPVFAIPGDGRYGIQPVHVDDVAKLCVRFGEIPQDVVRDAAGPERFTFEELVRTIGAKIGRPRRLIHCPPPIALTMARLIGFVVRDVVVNREELEGLMANLVVSREEPIGEIVFSRWLEENAETLGREYASEIGRNFQRPLQAE